MPESTEQVLFPERYAQGDRPIALEFPADAATLYDDVLGESDMGVWVASLSGATQLRKAAPRGWGGDRYRVYRTPDGPALVWYVVWDDPRSAERFITAFGGKLRQTSRSRYRSSLESVEISDRPATRYVLAPASWKGWDNLPVTTIAR
jgi:hypothetical protein